MSIGVRIGRSGGRSRNPSTPSCRFCLMDNAVGTFIRRMPVKGHWLGSLCAIETLRLPPCHVGFYIDFAARVRSSLLRCTGRGCGASSISGQPGISVLEPQSNVAGLNERVPCSPGVSRRPYVTESRYFCSRRAGGPARRPDQCEGTLGQKLLQDAKWAVYRRKGVASSDISNPRAVRRREVGDADAHSSHECFSRRGAVRSGSGPEDSVQLGDQEPGLQTRGPNLLWQVWKRQKLLSPAQAADAAYFLALRRNPPEALLQQLTAYLLSRNPARSLPGVSLHRFLRVFRRAPGIAERCSLNALCKVLLRRISVMKPGELQLLLADLAAIYSPVFLPLFYRSAVLLRRAPRFPDVGPAVQTSTSTVARAADSANSDGHCEEQTHQVQKAIVEHDCEMNSNCDPHAAVDDGRFITPLHAAFLLHSYGKTDCRDAELFAALINIVDTAVIELVAKQRRMRNNTGSCIRASVGAAYSPMAGDESTASWAVQQLSGEALVMALKGLANLRCAVPPEHVLRLAELLLPYLLKEEHAVLGPVQHSCQVRLLFGAVSAFARLAARPEDLRPLIAAACVADPESLGPYEPCDLLQAAVALQRMTGLTPEMMTAAVAATQRQACAWSLGISAPETQSVTPKVSPTPTEGGSTAVTPDSSGAASSTTCDAWSEIDCGRLGRGSIFRSASYCYGMMVRAGVDGLRPALFSLHPSFRVSALFALASLDPILPATDRPQRKFFWVPKDSCDRENYNAHDVMNASLTMKFSSTSGSASSTPERPKAPTPPLDSSKLRSVTFGAPREPLHPILRSVILSLFYRVPCLSLRMLVMTLEALHACNFTVRELDEELAPHGKHKRWHRPFLAVIAREAVRKMHDATADDVVRFLLLYYVELHAFDVTLSPIVHGLHRLKKVPQQESVRYDRAIQLLVRETYGVPGGAALIENICTSDHHARDCLRSWLQLCNDRHPPLNGRIHFTGRTPSC